jgi:hypothetical protein
MRAVTLDQPHPHRVCVPIGRPLRQAAARGISISPGLARHGSEASARIGTREQRAPLSPGASGPHALEQSCACCDETIGVSFRGRRNAQ